MTIANEISNRIVIDLLRIGAYLQRAGNRISGDYGLTQQQFVVLNEIAVKGPLSQKAIVGSLLFEKSNVSKIVSKLKTLNLIDVATSTDDARITILTATPYGDDLWKNCMHDFDAWNKDWLSSLVDAKTNQVLYALGIMNELIK